MSKTPKEIWCTSGQYYDYVTDWSNGSWSRSSDGGVKYVRADRIEELEKELEYWRKDSADAWDKCEANRLKLEKAVCALELALELADNGLVDFSRYGLSCDADINKHYRTTLAALKGQDDE